MGLRNWLSGASKAIKNWLQAFASKNLAPAALAMAGGVAPGSMAAPAQAMPWMEPPPSMGGSEGVPPERPNRGFEFEPGRGDSGDWHQMASSNVNEIRYLVREQTLEVEFLNGYYYQYYNVGPDVFNSFLHTASPGRFVWNVLRARGYDYARIGSGAHGLPTFKTGNRIRTANVQRALLPEERAGLRREIRRLQPGQATKIRKWPKLKLARWINAKATPAQVRARNKARGGG